MQKIDINISYSLWIIEVAVFLYLGLPPIAYIASEAATATAMHIVKILVYGKLVFLQTLLISDS